MCGRFYDDESDYFPSDEIDVIVMFQGKIGKTKMKWGYTHGYHHQRIINAKCETLLEKPLFKDDVIKRRCVLSSKGFYEWNQAHHQISFESQSGHQLYMAGLYHNNEVVIITTKANAVMKPIHNRMPLLIHKEDVKSWLSDTSMLESFLSSECDDICIVNGNVQQSLFE